MKTNENSFNFIVRHYKKGAFAHRKGVWNYTNGFPWWKRHIVAATISLFILTISTFAAIYFTSDKPDTPAKQTVEVKRAIPETSLSTPMRIEFEDAPVSEIVKAIEDTYNISIKDVPSTEKKLTISFEGDCDDILDMLNQLLDSKMSY